MQLEDSSAQILVLNFIIALLASNVETFTLLFVSELSAALLVSNSGYAGLGSIWFPINRLSAE